MLQRHTVITLRPPAKEEERIITVYSTEQEKEEEEDTARRSKRTRLVREIPCLCIATLFICYGA